MVSVAVEFDSPRLKRIAAELTFLEEISYFEISTRKFSSSRETVISRCHGSEAVKDAVRKFEATPFN
jgi:predicted PP-loop superfamily ATPase